MTVIQRECKITNSTLYSDTYARCRDGVVTLYVPVCGGAAEGERRPRSHRRNREVKMVYFNFATIKSFK